MKRLSNTYHVTAAIGATARSECGRPRSALHRGRGKTHLQRTAGRPPQSDCIRVCELIQALTPGSPSSGRPRLCSAPRRRRQPPLISISTSLFSHPFGSRPNECCPYIVLALQPRPTLWSAVWSRSGFSAVPALSSNPASCGSGTTTIRKSSR
jgi:hypothetical protein